MSERLIPYPSPNVEIHRNGRVTDMILPNGEVRIIYGDHDYPTDTTTISKETDGIFLENITTPKTRRGLNRLFNGHRQYQDVMSYARNHNIPLLFHDVQEKTPLTVSHNISDWLSSYYIYAPYILPGLINVSIPEALVITSPLVLNSLSEHAAEFVRNSSTDLDFIMRIDRLAEKIVPYNRPYVLRLRNALWAAKINWALENGLGSHFTTVVGAAHVGLEDYLRMEAEGKKAKILRATTSIWPFFAEISSYYTIRRFSQRKKKGAYDNVRVYEVPKLKTLARVA